MFPVSVTAGPIRKQLLVFGPRKWVPRMFSDRALPGEPGSAESVPLRYSLAWGGPASEWNPVGLGPGSAEVARIDVERLQRQIAAPLLPAYVELAAQEPPVGTSPRVLPLPEPSAGPHRGYVGQWLLFAVLALVGWVVVVRRAAREPEMASGDADSVAP
jgi:hypothetical protein